MTKAEKRNARVEKRFRQAQSGEGEGGPVRLDDELVAVARVARGPRAERDDVGLGELAPAHKALACALRLLLAVLVGCCSRCEECADALETRDVAAGPWQCAPAIVCERTEAHGTLVLLLLLLLLLLWCTVVGLALLLLCCSRCGCCGCCG